MAIGRAIVREPKIFLFDEPLSNLDAELRVQMRRELGKLHQRLKSTMIYVTHDQVEAMTLADKIILLNKGRIAQFGTPLEIYNHPNDTFVAGFIGSPRINMVVVESPVGADFVLPRERFGTTPLFGKVTLGMRPEHLQLHPQARHVAVKLTVGLAESLGDSSLIYAALGNGEEFVLKLQGQNAIEAGTGLSAYIAPENILLFDEDGRAISHGDRLAAPLAA